MVPCEYDFKTSLKMDGDVQTMQSTQPEKNSGNVPDAVYFIHLIIVVALIKLSLWMAERNNQNDSSGYIVAG